MSEETTGDFLARSGNRTTQDRPHISLKIWRREYFPSHTAQGEIEGKNRRKTSGKLGKSEKERNNNKKKIRHDVPSTTHSLPNQ